MKLSEVLQEIYSQAGGVVLWVDNAQSYWTDLTTEIQTCLDNEAIGETTEYDCQAEDWGYVIIPQNARCSDDYIYLYAPSARGMIAWLRQHNDYPSVWFQLGEDDWIS